jgi:26S proteasome regulatory subunit N8
MSQKVKDSFPDQIVVHPTVLLSVVDHYYRLAKETNRRVIGALLGEYIDDKVDITNCYAIPFEEDPKDIKIWYVDHVYSEQMLEMFQKINSKEKIVGWYSSGPKIRPHDIEINEVFRKYCDKPVFVIIDVQEKKESLGIPAESYIMREEVDQEGQLIKTFFKLNTSIEASLPEEIGVEFMLKDINDPNRVGSVSKIINDKEQSLKALIKKLTEIKTYLTNVISGKIPVNAQIIYNIQEIFNLLPNFDTESLIKAMSIQTNNNYLVLYLTWLAKTVVALHKLINNKIDIKEEENMAKENAKKEEEKKKEKDKEKEKDKDKEGNKEKDKEDKKEEKK